MRGAEYYSIAIAGQGNIPYAVIPDMTPTTDTDLSYPLPVNILGLNEDTERMIASGAINIDDLLTTDAGGLVRTVPLGPGTYWMLGKAKTQALRERRPGGSDPLLPLNAQRTQALILRANLSRKTNRPKGPKLKHFAFDLLSIARRHRSSGRATADAGRPVRHHLSHPRIRDRAAANAVIGDLRVHGRQSPPRAPTDSSRRPAAAGGEPEPELSRARRASRSANRPGQHPGAYLAPPATC